MSLGHLSLTNKFSSIHIDPILEGYMTQFDFTPKEDGNHQMSPQQLLYNYLRGLVRCPKLSKYVKDALADIRLFTSRLSSDVAGSNSYEFKPFDLPSLERALDHAVGKTDRHNWLKRIQDGKDGGGLVFATILLLLPNLEAIKCVDISETISETLIDAAKLAASLSPPVSFQHLKDIELGYPEGTTGGFDANGLWAFLPFPKVRWVYGMACYFTGSNLLILSEGDHSGILPQFGVESLLFDKSAFDPESLARFLGGVQS